MTASETTTRAEAIASERARSADRARAFSHILVEWPSETGSPDEASLPRKLLDLFREWPYFQAHPDHLAFVESHGDPKTGSVVALVRGSGRECVALSGHFDTVTTSNYGSLAALACRPGPLAAELIAQLSSLPSRSAEEQLALDDLASGAFVPGRGMLDMKSGLAAGMACLDRFARQEDRRGNMLFMAVPDEENRSRGMRSLRDALPDLARRWDLDIRCGINLDATSDMEDGAEGRVVYLGTVGKVMPFAFVVGRATHAGYPLEGVSAHLIGAEIMRAVEVNPDLSEAAFGERSPPPVCLEAKDLRTHYDVTMPEQTWLAFNWLTYRRGADEVLRLFGDRVREALDTALDAVAEKARRHYAAAGGQAPARRESRILTLNALKQAAIRVGGPSAQDRFAEVERSLEREENPLLVSRTLVAHLVAEARIVGPAVIVGLASLYYPHTYLDPGEPVQQALRDVFKESAARVAADHGTSIKSRGFFGGICDMSFFGHRPDEARASFIRANTPAAAHVDKAPAEALEFPSVNIGPWGREYHQKHERVHAAYAFEILPDLLYDAARAILDTRA
ncbi:M20/M25/M40 family metallo-hydrolase [Microvirga pudoricolor]|uniref:M20/M25/M40 family metallo-hydrolase n=1 Tax=Microvirga pudoricolor TaxID=2778729 RepID=UPI0019518DF4|nr:M20/M25/M40 family metallo-hydrolase [Microvirga pudoricolor]MBM6596127.1 M20/M25/M40 family metallo-hydrolase [Microvirga pudoricolor]